MSHYAAKLAEGRLDHALIPNHPQMQTLYLRLSAVELRDAHSPLWPALQATRLAPRLSTCLLRLLLPPSSPRPRSRTSRSGLDALLACLHGQHVHVRDAGHRWRPRRDTLALADLGAVGVARDVFDAYVLRLLGAATYPATETTDAGKSLGWDQVSARC